MGVDVCSKSVLEKYFFLFSSLTFKKDYQKGPKSDLQSKLLMSKII